MTPHAEAAGVDPQAAGRRAIDEARRLIDAMTPGDAASIAAAHAAIVRVGALVADD